ncbi:LysR family transcriptional regulator [Pseudomonas aeruginosa]|uniref:LysR family transcriptional regulator n=1 Tax=Pseudomonas aeruginosa TaxID=287 RepID=UPI0007A0B91C|nr:LysR family transcriptional regulator [Pseudomonas aeruginosa]KYO84085.1 HTH-type transcriptional regulator SyrM 1 [Pseudomonas aeruginosa]
MDLKKVDLNLLLIFDLIFKEKKVSAVADALGVSQPAISRSLKRLRELLGDELFYRTSTGMEPTAYALHMAEPISYALSSLSAALSDGAPFDPLHSKKEFIVRMSDIGEIYILPRLLRVLAEQAPGVSVTIVRGNNETLKSDMESGRIDLAIGLLELEAGFFRRQLYKQGYVCVFRRDHPFAKEGLTLEDFLEADHVVVTAVGSGHAKVDELIEKKGIRRKIKLRVPQYASLEHLLKGSDLIATVPEALVQPGIFSPALGCSEHPVQLPRLSIDLFWHARLHRDPANQWLRNVIAIQCELPKIS